MADADFLIIAEREAGFDARLQPLLLGEDEEAGFRHTAPGMESYAPARGRERWVVNKIRALCSWYTKGLDGGAVFRTSVNAVESIPQLRALVQDYFFVTATALSCSA